MSGFWDESASQYINMSVGAAAAAGSGAYTIAALWKSAEVAVGNTQSTMVAGYNSTSVRRGLITSGGNLFGEPSDFSSGFPGVAAATWYVSGIGKPAGSAHNRFHHWAYASDGSGTMTHGESTTGAANFTDLGVLDAFHIGDGEVKGNGLIAVVGVWTSELSDADMETLMSGNLSDWAALSPAALFSLENWDGSTGCTDVVGTSTQTSLVGTVGTGANPPSFNFALGPTVVNGTGAAALGGLTGSMTGVSTTFGTGAASLGELTGTMAGTAGTGTVSGTGHASLGRLDGEMAGHQIRYLFTPPQRKQVVQMVGALRYSFQVSETVWKDGSGVWQHQQTPSSEALLAASQLLAVGGRPQLVDKVTAIELTDAGIGTISPPVPRPVSGSGLALFGSLSGVMAGHVPPMPGFGGGEALLGGLAGSMAGHARQYGSGSVSLGGLTGTAVGVVRKYGSAAASLGGLSGSAAGASPTRLGATWASGSIAAGSSALNATNTYQRIYSAGDPTGWATTYVTDSQAAMAPGGILHFSFKNAPTSTNVNTFMDGIPAGTTVWLTYHHEDEQGTGGDVPLATYQANWATLRTLADAHAKRSQVILVGVLTEYRCTFGGENWQDWWTGHEDKMAVDCYNLTPSGNAYRAASAIWNIASEIASVTGFPAAVPEYGADLVSGDTTGSGRVACINSQIAYLRANPGIVDAVSWFSENTIQLSSDTGLQNAWRTLCDSQ